ncbi:MAG TPA: helix-turn-helix domain-containing protein [Acidimicrobiales bacterium]|nr:helix-turn-helix domain-containing protein [Acidimicrobiales bacterium]
MARPAPGADRSVAVLELLASHPDERFTLSEVARRCDLNKATAHALLSALSDHGVLLRHPGEKRYSLGPRLIAIGDAARRGYTALDFVAPVLAALADRTGLWARAWRVLDDHTVPVAQAGVPRAMVGRSLGAVQLPLAPPLGSLFVAWSDEPTIQAWLARAASAEAVRPALEALPVIRRRGYAVALTSPEWRALSEPREGGLALPPDELRRLVLAVARQPLLLAEVDEAATYRPADLGAPVFSSTGDVELVLTLSGLPDEDTPGSRLVALAGEVVAAARELTAAVRGRPPDAT